MHTESKPVILKVSVVLVIVGDLRIVEKIYN